MPTHSSTDDDEALARILQQEEHSRRTGQRSIELLETDQELRDLELARQFAQMEMQDDGAGGGGRRSAVGGLRQRSSTYDSAFNVSDLMGDALGAESSSEFLQHQQHSPSRVPRRSSHTEFYDAFAAEEARQRRANASLSSPVDLRRVSSLEHDFPPDTPPSRQPPRQQRSYDHLEYARQLQEQALSDIRRGNANEMSGSSRGTEDSDLELARRMQEMEDFGMGRETGSSGNSATAAAAASASRQFEHFGDGSGGAPGTAVAVPPDHMRGGTVDERLARFMEATGRSMRDISSDELNNLMGQGVQRPQPPARERFAEDMTTVREIHVEPTERPAVRVLRTETPGRFTNATTSQTPASPRRFGGSGSPNPYPQSAPTTPIRSRASGGNSAAAAAAGGSTEDETLDAESGKKKKGRSFLGRFTGGERGDRKPIQSAPGMGGIPHSAGIPAAIPPAHMLGQGGIPSAIPSMGAVGGPRGGPHAGSYPQNRREFPGTGGGGSPCVVCGLSSGTFVVALENKYHPDCFRCAACHDRIDVMETFEVSRDAYGRKQGYHRKCFAEIVGARCAVCRQTIPANPDGSVCFVKHPFFDAEQMCPRHAGDQGRRCTGCHRFEPEDDPFVDLYDAERCVCHACCRSVIMSSTDVTPLWKQVLGFLEHKLGLPIWDGMREIPVLIVGANELNDHLLLGNNPHGGSSQIMTRGLCLTHHDHRNASLRFKLPSMRFNQSISSFEALDVEKEGFTYYEVPRTVAGNADSNVFAIMCLSGLPKDLTASILAHEALHAWVKLHPQYDIRRPVPAQVEEGCAQLISMLFLNDGLDDPQTLQSGEPGPSDAKLRQYFRFSIETDDNEIYGAGYRKAAIAYREIGIEALLMHIVRYRDFPQT